MPASARVQVQDIVNALLRCKGNVAATADELGMRRNSLYERMERLGLRPESFRSGAMAAPFQASGMSGMTGSMSGMSGVARKKEPARYSVARQPSSLPRMTSAAAVEDEPVPIATKPAQAKPVRVRPDNQDRLCDAKRRLAARFNVETDESLLLNQFIEEQLDSWVSSKLSTKRGRAPSVSEELMSSEVDARTRPGAGEAKLSEKKK